MTLPQLLRLLKARKALLILVALATCALVTTVSVLLPKTYVAQVALVVEMRGTDPVMGNPAPPQLLAGYLNTQMDIIKSRGVALKVVDKFKLTDDPAVQARFMESTQGVGSIRDWISDRLLGNLDVIPSRNSGVFQIAYAASDAGMAAQLANAWADAYIETSIELKLEPAKRQSLWFEEQLVGLRKTLEAAQRKLSDFQRTNGLVTTDGRLDVETARLSGITSEAVNAQAAMSDAQTRRAQLQQALRNQRVEELPDVLGNALLQSMKAELVRKEAKLSELAERYGSNHPQYISAAAEVSALREKLYLELETAKGAIFQAAEIAERRSRELQNALDEQKQKILEMKRANDERDVLTREVESAQRTYDAATQRGSAVRLESQLDQSSVAVLAPAVRPFAPARPRVMLNSLASLVFGFLVGGAIVIAAELRNRRVRSGADLVEVVGVVLLAELPKVARQKKPRRLAPPPRFPALPRVRPA